MPRSCSWLLVSLLAGCASAPSLTVQDPEATLTQAEQALEKGEPSAALELVESLDPGELPRRLRAYRELIEAEATLALGEPWDAYYVTRDFPDRHPHSELRGRVAMHEYRCACALIKQNGSFLFFYSDRRRARVVLEHIYTRYADHDRVPDALRLLGDLAYENGDYTLAQERYRDLMRRYPDNEWVVYCRFQYAMSIVAGLEGLDYDLDRMESASRELRDFLSEERVRREFPALVTAANETLERLLEWRAERHLRIANFYDRIDNEPGYRLHLEMANTEELAETDGAARARELLTALGEAPAEVGTPAVPGPTAPEEGR